MTQGCHPRRLKQEDHCPFEPGLLVRHCLRKRKIDIKSKFEPKVLSAALGSEPGSGLLLRQLILSFGRRGHRNSPAPKAKIKVSAHPQGALSTHLTLPLPPATTETHGALGPASQDESGGPRGLTEGAGISFCANRGLCSMANPISRLLWSKEQDQSLHLGCELPAIFDARLGPCIWGWGCAEYRGMESEAGSAWAAPLPFIPGKRSK